jgi:squalene-associated FAD-dependent desaturase
MKKKIIIVGGGIAGISAAMELILNGFDVEMHETKNNLGGRVYSLFHKPSNENIDNGQHIMVGAYDRFFEILNKIGTFDKLYVQKALKVIFYTENNEKIVLDSSKLPGKLGLVYGLMAMQGLSFSDKLKYIYLYMKITYGNCETEISVKDFLLKNYQSENLIKKFWDPLVIATLNTSLEKASAKLLINIMKLSFFADSDKAKIFIPSVDFSELIKPFESWFSSKGGSIKFSSNIGKVELKDNTIDKLIDSKNNTINGDVYLFTFPPSRLNKILPDLNQDCSLDKFKSSSITSIYFWFDKVFFEDDFAAVLGKNIQWIFNRRKIMNSDNNEFNHSPEHLTITISDSDFLRDLSQEELTEICLEELHDVFPESKNCKLIHSKVIKEINATFLADVETEKIRPENRTKFNNLFIAGDWTNTGLPATIEGAAKSGLLAARDIIKAIS